MPDVQLTWLGHGTFRFDTPGGKRVYVDPWVTNPKISGQREGAGADRRDRDHARPRRPRREHARPGREVRLQVVAPVELADWLVWMKKAVRGGQDPRSEQGRHGRPRRGQGHAPPRAALGQRIDVDHMVYLGEPVGFVFEVENGTKLYFAADPRAPGATRTGTSARSSAPSARAGATSSSRSRPTAPTAYDPASRKPRGGVRRHPRRRPVAPRLHRQRDGRARCRS